MTSCEEERERQHLGDVRTLPEFLAAIARHLDGATSYLFRGHREEAWQLKPGIARYARNSGGVERDMLDEFKRRAIPYLESGVDLRDADWLAIAQHHKMPTRLLDWSGSALTALWFAINQPVDTSAVMPVPPRAAVWMLGYKKVDLISEKELDNPFKIVRTALFKPRHVSRRIAAQDGWFTVHRSHESDPRFVSLETNRDFGHQLHYVTIPATAFGPMRLELKVAGISGAALFPDLDGIASIVTGMHLFPDDEIMPRLGHL